MWPEKLNCKSGSGLKIKFCELSRHRFKAVRDPLDKSWQTFPVKGQEGTPCSLVATIELCPCTVKYDDNK